MGGQNVTSDTPSDVGVPSHVRILGIWCAAAAGTVGLWLQLTETSAKGVPGKSIVWVVALAALLCVGLRARWTTDRRVQTWAGALAAAFSLACVLGAQLKQYESLHYLFATATDTARTIATWCGLAAALWLLLVPLLGAACAQDRTDIGQRVFLGRSWKALGISTGIMLLAWLPFYSAHAPGLLITDSTNQVLMTLGEQTLTNHHPVIHTGTIAASLGIGKLVGSLSFGVALYSVGQMVLLAATFALSLRYLAILGAPLWLRAAALAYFALGHMNLVNAVTMWKDTPHAIATLLLVLLLFDACRNPAAFWAQRSRLIEFVIVAFFFCTFRNNGLWAFILFVPVLLALQRGQWRRICGALAALVVLLGAYNALVFGAIGAKGGSIREALSVPLQQIARTERDHGAELSATDLASIDALFGGQDAGALYNPHSSDPVKAAASTSVLGSDLGRFTGLYVRLGLAHPGTYTTSFLANSYGNWYPDSGRQSVNQASVTYAQSKGVAMTPWYGFLGLTPRETGAYLAWWDTTPILSMAGSMGFMVWLLAFAAVTLVLKRQSRLLLPFALLACLWLTVLASPLWGDFRYMYGVIVCGPLCLGVALAARRPARAQSMPNYSLISTSTAGM